MTMFKLSPSQVRKEVISVFEAGLVPFITSSPGLGKSAILSQIAQDFGLEMIDLRLSQCAPEDLMGLPMRSGDKAEFVPFAMFPMQGDKLPKGKNGWLLFLDEFNSASKSVQAAAYKIVLDHMVGQHRLHDDVFIACAGNLATDRAIVNQQSTAMQSRLIHLEMEVSQKDFIKHATEKDFDHRIMGFLEFQPQLVHNFNPDHQDRTFACPRTWEFVSKLIKDKPFEDISLPLLAGTISDGVAVEFHSFLQEYTEIPSYGAIRNQPDSTEIPSKSSSKYAVITMMIQKMKQEDFKDIVEYAKRFPTEFQVIFFRGVVHRFPKIQWKSEFVKHIMHLTEFLNNDSDDDGSIAA